MIRLMKFADLIPQVWSDSMTSNFFTLRSFHAYRQSPALTNNQKTQPETFSRPITTCRGQIETKALTLSLRNLSNKNTAHSGPAAKTTASVDSIASEEN